MSSPACLYTADYLLADSRTLLPRGAFLVEKGRVIQVGSREDFPENPDYPVQDFPGGLLFPGLVDAHVHLEYGPLDGQLPREPFAPWLEKVIAAKKQMDGADVEDGIRKGIEQSLSQGVTTLGEVASLDRSQPFLKASGLRYVCFLEIISLVGPSETGKFLESLERRIIASPLSPNGRLGLSPHSPCTVSLPLMQELTQNYRDAPFAIHLAESEAERDLLEHRSGPLQQLFEGMGFFDRKAGRNPDLLGRGFGDFLKGRKGACLIHGNALQAKEITALAQAGHCLTLCPGTRAFHGQDNTVPVMARNAGLPLALGTDSLASNDTLSLWTEMARFRKAFPAFSPSEIFAMATKGGAAALGLAEETGALTSGAWADFCLTPLEPEEGALNLPGLLEKWMEEAPQVQAVWVGGKEMFTEN